MTIIEQSMKKVCPSLQKRFIVFHFDIHLCRRDSQVGFNIWFLIYQFYVLICWAQRRIRKMPSSTDEARMLALPFEEWIHPRNSWLTCHSVAC